MVHGRPSLLRRLLRLLFPPKPTEAKGKPRECTKNHMVFSNVLDYPMEVFLDEHGNIKEPLESGISFDFCTIDRWYMPDCVPGIWSQIDITKRPKRLTDTHSTITVLFANDKYIQIYEIVHGLVNQAEAFFIEPEDDYYKLVEEHFVRRGFEHLKDRQPSVDTGFPAYSGNQGQVYVAPDGNQWTFNNQTWVLNRVNQNNGCRN